MIQTLKNLEAGVLLDLLKDPSKWKTLDIDYHPPHVERVWTQLENYRIYLHIIHPCTQDQSLYHSHPWSSSMHILNGVYEMGIGYSDIDLSDSDIDNHKNNLPCKVEFHGEAYYEMTNPNGWHYVRPITTCMSIMITGEKWDGSVSSNKLDHKLSELSEDRKINIINSFYNLITK